MPCARGRGTPALLQASKQLQEQVEADAEEAEREKRRLASDLIRGAKEQERSQKHRAYRKQLEDWLRSQLHLFDTQAAFRMERVGRHGSRAAYKTHLDTQVTRGGGTALPSCTLRQALRVPLWAGLGGIHVGRCARRPC